MPPNSRQRRALSYETPFLSDEGEIQLGGRVALDLTM